MIEIRDVWSAARLLIWHYDAEAGIRVSERIEMLAASGDLGGAEAWRSIRNAVDELQRQTRRDGPAAAAPPGLGGAGAGSSASLAGTGSWSSPWPASAGS